MKVSVYVPAYNVAEFLPRCIEALQKQTHQADEILVIDDGSRDATREIAGSYPAVTLIPHPDNRGLGAARNTAFQAARNELVAALDADCVAEPGWLANLVARIGDERLAGVGGRLLEGVQDSIADRWRCAHMPQQWGDEPLEDPAFLFGCNNLLRKSAVLSIGGYDASMRTNGEDADMSRRLKAAGWRLLYEPRAVATHLRHDTILSIMNTFWRWTFHGFENRRDRLTLYRILRRTILGNIWHMFRRMAQKDLSPGRWELLIVDVALLFYFPQRELREWLSMSRRSAKSADSQVSSRAS
jgi:glycosyltransferase involved in cell wall biosynthesis